MSVGRGLVQQTQCWAGGGGGGGCVAEIKLPERMRQTYCADRERSQHYEKKENRDTEHDEQQGQTGVKTHTCTDTGNTDTRTDSLIYAEHISERRRVKLSAISGQGTTDWRWQGTHFSLEHYFVLPEMFTVTVLLFQS